MVVNVVASMSPSTDICAASASGIYIYDRPELKGRRYIDFSASTNNLVLGHNHPNITQAIIEHLSSGRPLHASSRYLMPTLDDYLSALGKALPEELSYVNYKLSDGSDSVEETIKSAVTYQRMNKSGKSTKVIVFNSAHHGETIGTIAASKKHIDREPWHTPLQSMFVYVPDFYDLDKLEALLEKETTAAILLEPILVNGGVIMPPEGYLEKLKEKCELHRVTLIYDEAQTGFGWLGKYTAAEYFSVVPDLAAFGKGLGNGMTIALAALKPEYDVLDYNQTGFTDGGTPINMAAATAVINTLPEYMGGVEKKSAALLQRLDEITSRDAHVKKVRGAGLIAGVEFVSKELAGEIYSACIQKGLILRKSGPGNTLIFKIPIIVTEDQLLDGLERFEHALDEKQ